MSDNTRDTLGEVEVRVTDSVEDKVVVARMMGHVGYLESKQLQPQLDRLLGRTEPAIILECSELSFISSSGLRAILQFARQAQEKNKKLGFAALRESVAYVFDISGFTKILNIYDDQKQAEAKLLV
ncbi:MAG: STAS domain-containing protein [Pseudomonadota bacterium]|nr:STAS domain-containing protein [Pseudomonadota bacterium]